jgi:crossover junction endodeoxyribonuclease RuvC
MRVLACDPGFERLGVAILERAGGKETLLYSGCYRTDPKLSFPVRLRQLGEAVEALLDEWRPVCIALEEIYFDKNAKTAMKVAEVRGMLTYLATSRDLRVEQFTPLQVKIAVTGHGRSDKTAVGAMVARLLPLPQRKRLDDEIDAIAIGLACLSSVRRYPHTASL